MYQLKQKGPFKYNKSYFLIFYQDLVEYSYLPLEYHFDDSAKLHTRSVFSKNVDQNFTN